MTRILMIGAALSGNFGGPSLLISICKCLRKTIPDLEFSLLTGIEKNPNQAQRYEEEYNVVRVNGIRARHKYLGLIQAFLWKITDKIGIPLPSFIMSNRWLDELRKVDVVMDTRGISQSDFFSSWRAHIKENIPLVTASYLGKCVIKYTQDMGPFLNRSNRLTARYCFKKLDMIIARGIITRELLKEIGISKNVNVLPDTAFILDPVPVEEIEQLLEHVGSSYHPLIGIAPSRQVDQRILKGRDKTQQNEYTLSLARIADHMIENFQVDVVFIANEQAKEPNGYDDIFVAKKIYNKMKHKKKARVFSQDFSAKVTKGLIGKCNLMIASRYHSAVAAFSMCIPSIVLGWGFKYDQLTEMVGQRAYLFNYENINYTEMEMAINRLWEERDLIKENLERIIPRIQDTVYLGGSFVKDILPNSL